MTQFHNLLMTSGPKADQHLVRAFQNVRVSTSVHLIVYTFAQLRLEEVHFFLYGRTESTEVLCRISCSLDEERLYIYTYFEPALM